MLTDHESSVIVTEWVATITIRGGGPLNILGTPVMASLTAVIESLATDPNVRVAILRGAGDRAFVVGADINEMAGLSPGTAEKSISTLADLCEALRMLPVPVIARMPGWSLGGGLEVAMACDLRIASEDAKLGMPEVKVGIPSVIHAALLPRLVGQSRATWMLLSGELIDAGEGLRDGLLHRVVPLSDLDAEIDRIAKSLAGMGPEVLRQQKRLLREWQDLPFTEAVNQSKSEFRRAFTTGEPQHFMGEYLRQKKK